MAVGGKQGGVSPECKQVSLGGVRPLPAGLRRQDSHLGAPVSAPPARQPLGPTWCCSEHGPHLPGGASSDILEEDGAFSLRGQGKVGTPASLS